MTNDRLIRPVRRADAPGIRAIYNHYVEHATVTFEETPVSVEVMGERIEQCKASGLPWLVAVDGEALRGYALATPWKTRSAYRYSVESSVYVDPDQFGQGWGSRLYEALFAQLRTMEVHAVLAGITLPNPISIALHEKLGMTQVAHLREVGFKFGQWRDVGYWQLRFP